MILPDEGADARPVPMRLFLKCSRCRLVRLMDSNSTLCDECSASEVTQTQAHEQEQTAD